MRTTLPLLARKSRFLYWFEVLLSPEGISRTADSPAAGGLLPTDERPRPEATASSTAVQLPASTSQPSEKRNPSILRPADLPPASADALLDDTQALKEGMWAALHTQADLGVKRSLVGQAVAAFVASGRTDTRSREAALMSISTYCDATEPFPVLAHQLALDLGPPEAWRGSNLRALATYVESMAKRQSYIARRCHAIQSRVSASRRFLRLDPMVLAASNMAAHLADLENRQQTLQREADSLWLTMSLYLHHLLSFAHASIAASREYGTWLLQAAADLLAERGHTDTILRLVALRDRQGMNRSDMLLRSFVRACAVKGDAKQALQGLGQLEPSLAGDLRDPNVLGIKVYAVMALIKAGRLKTAAAFLDGELEGALCRSDAVPYLCDLFKALLEHGDDAAFFEHYRRMRQSDHGRAVFHDGSSASCRLLHVRLLYYANEHGRLGVLKEIWGDMLQNQEISATVSVPTLMQVTLPFLESVVPEDWSVAADLLRQTLQKMPHAATHSLFNVCLRCLCGRLAEAGEHNSGLDIVALTAELPHSLASATQKQFAQLIDVAAGEYADHVRQPMTEDPNHLFEAGDDGLMNEDQAAMLSRAWTLRQQSSGSQEWPPSVWWLEQAHRLPSASALFADIAAVTVSNRVKKRRQASNAVT